MFKIRQFFLLIKKADFILLGVVFLLLCFGLVTIYGIELADTQTTFPLFKRQLFFSVIGFVLMFIFMGMNYQSLRSYRRHLYVLSCVLLILVLIFGETVRGTRGWFQVFGLGIQPVELAKFTIVVWLATYFSKQARNIDLLKYLVLSGVGVGIFVVLVLAQPDFGSSLTILGIWFLMLLVIGIRKLHLTIMIVGVCLISVCAWFFMFQPYQKERIMVFIDPSRDPLGRGYNITQAAIAVGSGKWFGRGLGYGSQSQLKFIPESQTDFIFAVIAEEFGFIGIVIICFLWFVFFWRLMRLVKLSENDFGAYLILGFAMLFFIQIMVNAGMNIGIMPVTGISLPFISYGGSFLIMSLIMVGIIQSIAIRK